MSDFVRSVGLLDALDTSVLGLLNRCARQSEELDRWVAHVAFNDLFKGALTVAVLWWAWFAGPACGVRDARRRQVAALVVWVAAALAFNRVLASVLPHRVRPLQDPELGLVAPFGVSPRAFSHLSAFPSDHAVMFLGFAAGAFRLSVKAGILLSVHALVVVLLPRLYLGLHWPTDLVAGAALGIGAAWASARPRIRGACARPLLAWESRHPASFYPLAFLLTWQLCALFDPAVKLAGFLFP